MESSRLKRDAFKWLWAVANLPVAREEKALLWPLALHADGNGTSFPGEALLCRESGIGSKRTLRRALRRLELAGWIETARNSCPVKIGDKTFYTNAYALKIPTGREDKAVAAHEGVTGGQIERHGRTNQTPREDKSRTTGGQSCGREMSIELPRMSTEPKKEPEQPRVGNPVLEIGKIIGCGRDRREHIACLSHEALPGYAATFCKEADPNWAVATYKKAIRVIGPEAFRAELDTFVAEVEAGEEPESRGKAFTSRLNARVESKPATSGNFNRRRVADNHYQSAERPYDGAF